MFRAYQGWLALSNTAPGEGTLQVFPDVLLSNAYLIMRPFFKPTAEAITGVYNPAYWKFGQLLTGSSHYAPDDIDVPKII